jgi:hypothetical protein
VRRRDLGWRRALLYSVALVVGGVAENGSVHFGVPYTRYTFNSDLRGISPKTHAPL